jgi:hypothetical protein
MYEVMRYMHMKRRKIFEKAFEDEIQLAERNCCFYHFVKNTFISFLPRENMTRSVCGIKIITGH